jgi:hypothetical protein
MSTIERSLWIIGIAATTIFAGRNSGPAPSLPRLVGAWHAHVQFKDGPFASAKDLDLMFAFNEGGTMTESSNYDESPPVPPAYGIWRSVGKDRFEARYEYYNTKPPTGFDDISKGGGWAPDGKGVLTESIRVAADGMSYRSTLRLDLYDASGKHTPGGAAVGSGTKMRF